MKRTSFVLACLLCCAASQPAVAAIVLGSGTASLLGGDLTDPDNNGDPENNINYNAVFFASEEAGFGGAEAAFNVFDNQVGGGNAKFCCGDQNNFPVNPISVGATFTEAYRLTHFTVTSGNDTPDRDPRVWSIEGSNDGLIWTPIFTQNDAGASVWTARDQVLRFDAGSDFAVQSIAYTSFRMLTTATGLTAGARFQLNEIELFGVPEPSTYALTALGAAVALFGARRARRKPVGEGGSSPAGADQGSRDKGA